MGKASRVRKQKQAHFPPTFFHTHTQHRWNYCAADTCDGGHKRGACHFKRWSAVNAPAWGCSGDWQTWRSGLASPSLRYDTTPPPCPDPSAPAASGVAAGVPTSVRQNWGGQLVILDVDSWKMGEGGNHGSPGVKSAYDCALQCSSRVGRHGAEGVTANAFSFCDDAAGCGSNCKDYTRGAAPMDGSKDELYQGPWGKGCTPNGAFHHRLCSCKAVGGAPQPLVDDSTQWISGYTVPRPN